MSRKTMVATEAVGPLPHPKLWQKLINLRAERTKAKVREVDLVKSRKELEEAIKQKGPKKSVEGCDLTFRYFWLKQTIEEMRLTQRTLADKVDKVIDFAAGGVLVEAAVDDFLDKLERGELDDDRDGDKDGDSDEGGLYQAPTPEPKVSTGEFGATRPDWKTPVGNIVRFDAAKKLSDLKLATVGDVHTYLSQNGWREDDAEGRKDAIEELCNEAPLDEESADLLERAVKAVLAQVKGKAAVAPAVPAASGSKSGETKKPETSGGKSSTGETKADPGETPEVDYNTPLANIITGKKAQDRLTEHGLNRLRDVKAYIGNASGEAGVRGLVTHINLSEADAAKVLRAMNEPVPEDWQAARGRGRPPKAEKPAKGEAGQSPARKRGRPPKAKNAVA